MQRWLPALSWRVDFIISVWDGRWHHLIVEADGQEFHATPEQKARDEQHDRAVREAGPEVRRFSGSSIWNSGESCVLEVLLWIARYQPYRRLVARPADPQANARRNNYEWCCDDGRDKMFG
jgi:very-short-patch-repair endonuclease